jgi:hypothetical protein
VTADEQTRAEPPAFLTGAPVIVAGIPADMGHVDGDAIAFPGEIGPQISAEFSTINVPVNAAHGFEGSETIQHCERTEISCVPHLVAFGEVIENGVIQKAMSIRKQSDAHSQW